MLTCKHGWKLPCCRRLLVLVWFFLQVLAGNSLTGWLLPQTPLARTSMFAALFFFFFLCCNFLGSRGCFQHWGVSFPMALGGWSQNWMDATGITFLPHPCAGNQGWRRCDPCLVPFYCPGPLLCAHPLPSSEIPNPGPYPSRQT